MALDTNGNATASLLYRPYGTPRYSSGGMRTPFGFTGQREDTSPAGSSGLDYFNARSYDTATGRFTSADDAQPGVGDPSGQDNYAYAGGMVESATDPSGHGQCDETICLRGFPSGDEIASAAGLALVIVNLVDLAVYTVTTLLHPTPTTSTPALRPLAPPTTGPVPSAGPVINRWIDPIHAGTLNSSLEPPPTPTQQLKQLPLPGFEPSETEGNANSEDYQNVAVQYTVGDQCAIERVDRYTRNKYKRFTGKQARTAKSRVLFCPYCGIGVTDTVDHIRSQKKDWDEGGYNDDRDTRSARVNSPSNLIGACRSCNSSKGDTPIGPGPDEWWPPAWPVGVWWPFGGP